ncbi:MAG: shikimate kinase [Alphaproteobacteria bacterium]|jgi:shikimate kinase|nr:shikimate kinase [Alphaproteobacteria bacterium]
MAEPPFEDLQRSIVLVGIMGAGKSAIGRRLAARLGLPFIDADQEIEAAAGCSIEGIFARFGEAEFRKGEERVIERLLKDGAKVLATGGGAFMNPRIRETIRERGISVWLRADLETLVRRVRRRDNRPLLKNGDQREIMARLIEARYPIYAEADIVVDSTEGPHDLVVGATIEKLAGYLAAAPAALVAETT